MASRLRRQLSDDIANDRDTAMVCALRRRASHAASVVAVGDQAYRDAMGTHGVVPLDDPARRVLASLGALPVV
jgi:hypothetical protein